MAQDSIEAGAATVVTEAPREPSVRLANLLAALSLGTDLGVGQPMEHVLRQCLISLNLASRLGPRRGYSQ